MHLTHICPLSWAIAVHSWGFGNFFSEIMIGLSIFCKTTKFLSKSKQSEFLCYMLLSLGRRTYPSSFHPDITFPLQWNSLARTKRNIIRVAQPEKNYTKRRVAISLQSLCHELNLYFMPIAKIQVYVVRYVQY